MNPNREQQDPKDDGKRMLAEATGQLGIPPEVVGIVWPRKPLGGRAMGQKGKGQRPEARGQRAAGRSQRGMRSSKSHPPRKYSHSPIGWE